MNCRGSLEVICGSMFSGKSEELIRCLRRAEFAKQRVMVFKHSLDDRKTINHVISHNNTKIEAIATRDPELILHHVDSTVDVVGIDEVQFFDSNIINIVLKLIDTGKKVFVAGLDLDFRGIPFGPMPTLMALSDKTTKLQAICMTCGNDAHFSQRIVNGAPAKFNDPIILPGAEECYQARCRGCFKIDRNMMAQL
jgi:thymidine kinase